MTPSRRTNRREFLHGQSAVEAIADLAAGDQIEPSVSPPSSRLLHVGRRAMACQFEIALPKDRPQHAAASALEALDLVDRLEAQLTVFRDDSELAHVNRTAAAEPVAVEPGLFDLLQLAQRLSEATGGAFDITAAPIWKLWGFHRRQGSLPDDGAIAEALRRVGYRHVLLDRQAGTVRFASAGVELNLGGIGKGYALDRAGEQLRSAGVGDFLFHGGQSSVLAAGSPGEDADAAWKVGLRHPMRPGVRLAEFVLRDRALSTSGSGTQFFRHAGRRYGHILDPRTGRPAEGVLSATVLAPTAAEADALSTALYVLGPEGAIDYCRRNAGVAVLLVLPGNRAGAIDVRSEGFEPDELILQD